MAAIGPELPPHLAAKRKRHAKEADKIQAAQPARTGSESPSVESESESKAQRIIGPAPPPAPLEERPAASPQPPDTEESSDEDGYGPALPSYNTASTRLEQLESPALAPATLAEESTIPQRDEWMMIPPKQDDLSARMDPTKLRARKFNTGKGAKGPSAGNDGQNTLWTETLEQKRKRLADEMLGISKPATESSKSGPSAEERKRRAEDEETARRIKDYNEQHRGKSLYEQHRKKRSEKLKEDDPSKRAFDYEKDMGGGAAIGYSQRKEMMRRTADFSSKFTSGSYS